MANTKDDLAKIDGIKPKKLLADGEEVEIKSFTSNTVYKIKRTVDHYYCTCPAWRNQVRAPINARSCKHIRELLGEKYEKARIAVMDPDGSLNVATGSKRKRTLKDGGEDDKKKRTRSKAADEDKDEEDEEDVRAVKVKKPDVLLAVKWDLEKGADPTGWWVSEKLDGVRVFYDGKRMLSRLGNPFTPPKWFTEKLPKNVFLDGELFGGRGKFQSTVSIVKTMNSPRWSDISFQVFDVPSMRNKPFEKRYEWLKETFIDENGSAVIPHVTVVKQTLVESREHVLELLQSVQKDGGEGLMLRKPRSKYEGCRSSTLQKVKTFYDAEAKVVGHTAGKGRNSGTMGALKCVMASGKTFNVGSGFSDQQRRKHPKIGTIITYRFQELTQDGVPRFPTFVGIAIDKDEPTDAEIPNSKKADVDEGSNGESS